MDKFYRIEFTDSFSVILTPLQFFFVQVGCVIVGIITFMCFKSFYGWLIGYRGKPHYRRFVEISSTEASRIPILDEIAFLGYFIGWVALFPFRSAEKLRQDELWTTWSYELCEARKLFRALPTTLPEEIQQEVREYIGPGLDKELLLSGMKNEFKKEFDILDTFADPSQLEALRAYKTKLKLPVREITLTTFKDAFTRLFKYLPAYVGDPALFKTSFVTGLQTTKPVDEFFHAFEREDKLFWPLFSEYTQNWYAAQSAVEARFYEKNSLPYFRRVCASFAPFSEKFAELPITIPTQLRFEGIWVIAPPGRGKTTLLSKLLSVDLQRVESGTASVILMDSKGDLIDHARKLKQFAPGGSLANRLVLIEPTGNLAVNPLDLGRDSGHTIALLEYVFSGLLDTAPTPLQSTLFRSVLLAMKAIPEATFDTFRQFLQTGWQPFEQYIRQMHPDDRDFFLNGEYDSKTYAETKQQLLWRIRDLTTKVPLLRDMFKAPATRLDIGHEMDSGKVIIIDNSAATLSTGSEFFARFFVALILAAAQQRAGKKDEEKLPVYFYIDECDTVIKRDNSIAEIIQRCRSQKIGLVLAHQALNQIESERVKAALSDCAIRIANSDDEAPQLAGKLRTTPEALRALKRGQFALFMRDLTPRPLIVNVENNPVSSWEKMTDDEFKAIQKRMFERYGFTPPREVQLVEELPTDDKPGTWG